MQLLEID